MKTITIIDTFGFLFRSYYALPQLSSNDGFPTGMITGFMNFISNIGKDFDSDYIIFAVDSKGDTFREKIYNQYKANRPEAPDDLKKQLSVCVDLIEQMGFTKIEVSGYEADDIICSVANQALRDNLKVRIVSHDKDLYQLITDDVNLFDPMQKTIINKQVCFDKYGVYPSQFCDYQALVGDSVDNIPGAKGIGAKTACALLQTYKSLDNIYENLDNIKKARWVKLLKESKENVYMSLKLVTLNKEAYHYDKSDLERFVLPKVNPILAIQDELLKYDLRGILDKVLKSGTGYKTQLPKDYKQIEKKEQPKRKYRYINDKDELFSIIDALPPQSIVAFDTETTSTDEKTAKIVGFSFSFNESEGYYVPLAHSYLGMVEQISQDIAKEAISRLNNHKLIIHNFKYDYQIIKNNFGIELKLFCDSMILAWLYDSAGGVALDKLSKKYLQIDMVSFKDIVKKDQTFGDISIEVASNYACEDSDITLQIYKKITKLLEQKNESYLFDLAKEVEFPFIDIIISMQNAGIKVDTSKLQTMQEANKELISKLTKEIYELNNGNEFNIKSPKQLAVVLFESLGILNPNKKKVSTDEKTLNAIKDEHEIISKILQYREVTKSQDTYVKPLLQYASLNSNSLIFTSFLQTGTATGRLSSNNPNLQNMPTKAVNGHSLREAFIARDGYVFCGIDYSQIELRILAHFSKDPTLCSAFSDGLDVHMQTAKTLFGEEDAKQKRDIAKSINFGLIYGMGASKLSQTINTSVSEAREYINEYFNKFSSVKEYLNSVQKHLEENGYSQTLLKRRRKFDFANANPMFKNAFLREGVNFVFQGSASDIIKLAMLKIYKKYNSNKDVNMLLQIHDELIFEIKEDIADEVANDLKEIMQNAYKLDIPLIANLKIANNWGDLK